MSMLRFTAAALTIAATTGYSVAQEGTLGQQNRPGTTQLGNPNQSTPAGQAGQTGTQNTPNSQTGSQSTPRQPGQQGAQQQGGQRGNQQAGMQQGTSVKEAIVQKLIKANEAEIELAQMAQQKVKEPELQEFTKMLVQDHQSLLQELQQHSGQAASQGQGSAGRANSNQSGANQPGTTTPNTSAPGQPREGSTRAGAVDATQLGTTQPSNTQRDASQLGGQQPDSLRSDQASGAAGQQGRMNRGQNAQVPSQLIQIASQACQNNLEMTKEMLSQYEDQDFQMAFLGQQAVAHTMMLAELKAIQSAGPEELKPIVEKAITSTQSHLEKAKSLAKKFENDQRSRASGE